MPDYQRPYSWEREHVSGLYQDLRAAFDEARRSNDERSYFIGPMVIVHRREPSGLKLDVVDGQQRLTTLMILFCALRDTLLELNETSAAMKLHDSYIVRSNLRGDEKPRLSLKTENDGFFQEQVIALPGKRPTQAPRRGVRGRPPRNRIKNSYTQCLQLLSDWRASLDPNERATALVEFAAFVVHQSLIVALFVDDIGYAHTIFETLNSRGLDLSVQDLVRNLLRQSQSKRVQESWSEVEERMAGLESGGGFRTFIRASWVARHGKVSFRELFETIRRFLKKHPRDGAETVARNFREDAGFFVDLVSPAAGDPAAPVLECLEDMGLRQHIPFLLSAKRCLPDRVFLRALRLVETISVRYLLVGDGNPNRLEDFYADAAQQIASNLANALDPLERKARSELLSSDHEFQESFANLSIERAAQARYLLMKLELFGNDEFKIRSASEVHVEHIVPKRPGPHWKELFPASDEVVNRLGNLTLLGEALNRGASNKLFQVKKTEYYKRSRIQLTKNLTKLRDWDEAALVSRQEELARLAVKVWPSRS